MPQGRRARARTRWIAIPLALAALVVWLAWRVVGEGRPVGSPALEVAPARESASPESVAADVVPAELSDATARAQVEAERTSEVELRRLEVRVVDDLGKRLSGGRVTLVHGGVELRSGGLGVVGVFDFDGVPVGEVEVLAEGFRGAYDAREPHRIEAGQGALRIELRLVRHVRVPVVLRAPDGERLKPRLRPGFVGFPVRPVVVAGTSPFGARLLGRAPVDDRAWGAGRYESPRDEDHDGVLECLVPPPLYVALVLGDSVLETRLLQGGERELVFVLGSEVVEDQLAGLVASVVDGATGRPPEGANGEPPRGFSLTDLQQIGRTYQFPMPDGRIELERLTPGRARLTLEVPGYALDRRVVELEPGRVNDLGTIPLWPAACISGHVVDPAGAPLAVVPRVAREIAADQGLEIGLGVPSGPSEDSPSWFAICSLPRAPLLLGLDCAPWAVNPMPIEPRAALVEGIELVARRGTQVRLVAPVEPGDDPWFCVRERDGRAIWAQRVRGAASCTLHLLPGSYRASAGCSESAQWVGELSVGDEDLELELVPLR